MARRTIVMSGSEQDQLFHCSPCFSTYLGIRNQIRRQQYTRTASVWTVAAVLVAVITYSGYRVLSRAATPQQFTTAFNMQERPLFRGIHQAATHPSPFFLP